jgi:RNA polymerase sigma-70 factor, ECF subfamily
MWAVNRNSRHVYVFAFVFVFGCSWENHDVDGFVALLTDDAIMTMPPWREWYHGRDAIDRFFTWTARPGGSGPFRLVPSAANGQPAFAFYGRRNGSVWRTHSIQLLTLEGAAISHMTSFVDASLFAAFGCADELDV